MLKQGRPQQLSAARLVQKFKIIFGQDNQNHISNQSNTIQITNTVTKINEKIICYFDSSKSFSFQRLLRFCLFTFKQYVIFLSFKFFVTIHSFILNSRYEEKKNLRKSFFYKVLHIKGTKKPEKSINIFDGLLKPNDITLFSFL